MYTKIILPVSGKDNGKRAIKVLKHVLSLNAGEIVLLHVTAPVSQIVGGEAHTELQRAQTAKGLTLLGPVIAELEKAGAPFHVRVEEGTPVETIIRIAHEEDADLIAMFTDGRDGLEDMLIGSITERVLRNSDITLLAVRH